jgi:hypothetical protein
MQPSLYKKFNESINRDVNDYIFESGIQLYVLTCDRLTLFEDTMKSVVFSGIDLSKVIISDNSTNDLTGIFVKDSYPNIEYIRRFPQLSPIDHLNLILNETNHEYLMMFHDDDLICPNIFRRILKVYADNPELVAVGVNAYVLDENIKTSIPYFKSKNEVELLMSPDALLGRFSSFLPRNIAPFPGYVYNMRKIKGIDFKDELAGRCSDVIFLFEISALGPLAWISEPLMYYREHKGNGGKKISNLELLGLIHFYQNKKLNGLMINKLQIQNFYIAFLRKYKKNLFERKIFFIVMIKMVFNTFFRDRNSTLEIVQRLLMKIFKY